MNRTLTAAVALAAGLGMAGLAHAQSSAGPSTSPNPMNSSNPSSQISPSMSTSPTGMQNPSTMSAPSTNPTYGAQQPQASAQPSQMGSQPVTSQSQIQQAQEHLKSQGLYNGAIDGVVGPETQTALSQFQRQSGLPATAQLDQQTLDRLMGNGAGNSTTAQPYSAPAGTQNPATAPMQNPGQSMPSQR